MVTLSDILFGAFMVAVALAVAWTVGSAVVEILGSRTKSIEGCRRAGGRPKARCDEDAS